MQVPAGGTMSLAALSTWGFWLMKYVVRGTSPRAFTLRGSAVAFEALPAGIWRSSYWCCLFSLWRAGEDRSVSSFSLTFFFLFPQRRRQQNKSETHESIFPCTQPQRETQTMPEYRNILSSLFMWTEKRSHWSRHSGTDWLLLLQQFT